VFEHADDVLAHFARLLFKLGQRQMLDHLNHPLLIDFTDELVVYRLRVGSGG
jgi:hypothetical protein